MSSSDVISISSDSTAEKPPSWSDYLPPFHHGPNVEESSDSSMSSYVSSYHSSSEDDKCASSKNVKPKTGTTSKTVEARSKNVEAKTVKGKTVEARSKNVKGKTVEASSKVTKKPPGPVAVLGLPAKKTWEEIKAKTFGFKVPAIPVEDTKGKGKKHLVG